MTGTAGPHRGEQKAGRTWWEDVVGRPRTRPGAGPGHAGQAASSRLAGVVFDLDGTLVDSTYLHAVCWWQALRQFGHAVPTARLHRAVGMGSRRLLTRALGPDRDLRQDDAISAAHDALFATFHERLVPLPGAVTLLGRCADEGLAVSVASSAKPHDLALMLRVLDDPRLDDVTSAEDAERTKPSPDLLTVVLDRVGLHPSESVYVGDSVWDVEAALSVGMACIGLECGGTSAGELRGAGAVAVFSDPADLLDKWEDSPLSVGSR